MQFTFFFSKTLFHIIPTSKNLKINHLFCFFIFSEFLKCLRHYLNPSWIYFIKMDTNKK